MTTWIRPFKMFLTEPIVLTLSLLNGFSDALIFMFIQSLSLGLAFIPILVGYVIAWVSFFPATKRNIQERRDNPESERAQYESRLWWLLYTAPCLPIGLIGFAWTSLPQCHWIGTMIFAAMIGIANYAIYMATIDYMVRAYGPYSVSATGGNGWARECSFATLSGLSSNQGGLPYRGDRLADNSGMPWGTRENWERALAWAWGPAGAEGACET
ncbi:Major facilitator superfamily domain general substrate transporter [Penicillium bovifimosum]|uniref:Major facilitator superfamily domain general substrate transporter n=1 Tax=Penicillium bovifimosum TaxID=126998 RepID=A0A9W9KVF4_9EURO|nr:Major facilitator superfamily domain general substrate transporter [Penicillium bovifimosum]KAJ5120845.1 Major facilitator superfamily domain general substrate transporter [Penicillium bovifimosum]